MSSEQVWLNKLGIKAISTYPNGQAAEELIICVEKLFDLTTSKIAGVDLRCNATCVLVAL
jgi:hypothetical protein